MCRTGDELFVIVVEEVLKQFVFISVRSAHIRPVCCWLFHITTNNVIATQTTSVVQKTDKLFRRNTIRATNRWVVDNRQDKGRTSRLNNNGTSEVKTGYRTGRVNGVFSNNNDTTMVAITIARQRKKNRLREDGALEGSIKPGFGAANSISIRYKVNVKKR